MKPASLQDAIKQRAAKNIEKVSKGEWKEPVVKSFKVTAEDLKAAKATEGGKGRSSMDSMSSGPDTTALRQEIDMLRNEMRNQLKLFSDQQKQLQAALAKAAPAPVSTPDLSEKDDKNKDLEKKLDKELSSVRTELSSLRRVLQDVEVIPDEIEEIRDDLKKVRKHVDDLGSRAPGPSIAATEPVNDSKEIEPLLKDIKKVKLEIKEIRLMVSQSQDGTALAKELRVMVEQQESTIERYGDEIDDLKEEVRMLKRRLETAESTAQEAKELAALERGAAALQELEQAPKVIPMSPTNRVPKLKTQGSKKGSQFDDDNDQDNEELTKSPDLFMANNAKKATAETLFEAAGNKDKLLVLDSDEEVSYDGSDLYPEIKRKTQEIATGKRTLGDKDGSSSDEKEDEQKKPASPQKTNPPRKNVRSTAKSKDDDDSSSSSSSSSSSDDDDDTPVRKTREAANNHAKPKPEAGENGNDNKKAVVEQKKFSPSNIVLDDDGGYKKPTDDDDDDDSSSSSDSDPSDRKPLRARSSSFDDDLKKVPRTPIAPPKDGAKNKESDSEDSSASETPQKRKISLLPHKAEALYQEQRKDTVLRKFITKGKTSNMSVHDVLGFNLVFFSDKIYIPESLREETMAYYKKKYKQTALVTIEKNCFWPDLQEDMTKFGKKDIKWRVEVLEEEHTPTKKV